MINFGKTIGQGYAEAYLIENKYIRAHEEGRIFLKSLSSYALGITESSHLDYTNCCIDDIQEFTLYLIRSLTHFKEEQYQEQTVCNLDQIYVYSLVQEFKKDYIAKLKEMFSWEGIYPYVSMDLFEEKIRSFQKIQRLCCDEIETHSKIDTIFQRAYEIVLQHLMEKLEKAFEYFLVFRAKHRRHQNYAVHPLMVKRRQIFHLFFGVILCDRKNHLIVALVQHGKNPLDDPADRCRCNLRHDHADHIRLFCPQCLCVQGRMIAGFLHHPAD